LAHSLGVLTLSEFVCQVIGFVLNAYLARTLGLEIFGLWVFAVSIIGFLMILVDSGTETWGMREVSAHPSRLRKSIVDVMALRLVLACLIAASLCLIAFVLISTPDRRWLLVFGTTSLLAAALQTNWALRGIEIAVPVAAGNLLQRTVMLVLALALVRSSEDVRYLTLWQGTADLMAALLWLLALTPRSRLRLTSFRSPTIRGVLNQAWPMGASRILRGLMLTGNVAVLAYFSPDTSVGEYGAAQRIMMALLTVSSIYGAAVFPSISRACEAGGLVEQTVLSACFRLLATILVPLCVGGVVLAEPIVVFVFTERYQAVVLPLQIMMIALLVMAISDNIRRVLYARGHQGLDLRLMTATALVGLATSMAIVPLAGALGAACAALIGELTLLVLAARGVRRTGPAILLVRALALPVFAAGIMAASIFPIRSMPLVVSVPAGMLIYVALLLLLRSRTIADLRQIETVAPLQDASQDG
jgi:PST family polysaccharide transporter